MVDYGGGAKGAAGGAAVGTAILPGWGTAIGAGVGGLIGLFGGGDGNNAQAEQQKAIQAKLQALADSYSGRAAPQLTQPVNQAQAGQYSAQQAGLISQLQSMAAGGGPSAAAIQMREAMDRAAAAQTSAAAGAGGRGVNQGAAYLNAANNGAAIAAQGARDTSTLRAQEQLNAVGQLGQNLAVARGADDQMAQFNAGAQNTRDLANLQAQLQMLGLNDEGQLRALTAQLGGNVNTGPGIGTQILAGGAQLLPYLVQRSASGGNGSGGTDYGQQYLQYQQSNGPVTTIS
jgi:hypothetical protein